MPPSSHRDPLSELFALFHLLQILAHFGVHVAGSNGVDIDAATAPLRGERHGQLFDAALAGDIRRHVPQADERIGGGDVDNFSLALFQHHLASQLAHKENALDVDPHNAIPSVLGELLGGAAILKSGTVDQNIQPSTQS